MTSEFYERRAKVTTWGSNKNRPVYELHTCRGDKRQLYLMSSGGTDNETCISLWMALHSGDIKRNDVLRNTVRPPYRL